MPEPAPSASAEALYRELVVRRARDPLHAGAVDAPSRHGVGVNPLCGDHVEISLRRDGDGTILALRHRTEGCAICIASADLMADAVLGLAETEAVALGRHFEALLRDGASGMDEASRDTLGLLNAFADLHDYRSRRKCAMLPWSALAAAFGSGGDS